MGEEQKIWFVYLGDHHEGPFTPEEVGAKVQAGSVNEQTLGWKDGLPEWVPVTQIPELAGIFQNANAPAAADVGGSEAVSLAQLLAQTQKTKETLFLSQSAPGAELAAGLSSESNEAPAETGAVGASAMNAFAQMQSPQSSREPGPDEIVWTARVGSKVNGLYSLNQLAEMIGEGEVPLDAMVWHGGWSDFRSLKSVPKLAGIKPKASAMPTGTRTGLIAGSAAKMAGLSPITSAADIGDDEDTDTGITSPGKGKFAGFASVIGKIKGLFAKRNKGKIAAPASAAVKAKAPVKAITAKKGKGIGAAIGKIAGVVALIAVLGGAGAAYYFLFMSPIPSSLDVLPDDLESMKEIVKSKEGGKLILAKARGTEDNPIDDTAPKFYVATNLEPGATVTMQLIGVPGTLVNRIAFDKTFTATVAKTHIAEFPDLQEDGKPLPMGEYTMKITAESADPLEVKQFVGGKKGAAYTRRLDLYKKKLQEEFDKDIDEVRQLISTLKGQQFEISRLIAAYKSSWSVPAQRPRIGSDWTAAASSFQAISAQLDSKLKSIGEGKRFATTYKDIGSTLAQLGQLVQAHSDRLKGTPPTGSPPNLEELEGFVQAGVASLEQWLAQAVLKNPMEVADGKDAMGSPPKAPASAPASSPAAPLTSAPPPNAPAPAAPAAH